MMKSEEWLEWSGGRGHKKLRSGRTPHLCEGDQGGRGEGWSVRSRSGSRQRRCGGVLEVSACQSKMACDIGDHPSLPVTEPLLWAPCQQHASPFTREIRPVRGKYHVM